MDGGNSNQNNQNKPNTNTNQPNQPKSGLSWTQPASGQTNASTQDTSKSTQTQKAVVASEVADSTGRVIGIIVGIIVVFAIAAWGIVTLNKRSASNEISNASSTSETGIESETPTEGQTTETTPTARPTAPLATAEAGSASLSVPSTQAAGAAVMFQGLSIAQPTWVVVYDNSNGKPGNILGAGLFFKGDTSGSVNLLRATTAGQTYYVGAAVDNGDKSFTKADEKYVQAQNGSQLLMSFQAQ